MDTSWIKTSKKLPPEGEVIETRTKTKYEDSFHRMVRWGEFWFMEGQTYYNYWRPNFWRKAK
jgi:hypothetical protein